MNIFIKVKPSSKINLIGKSADGTIVVKIKAPANDGKANAELIRFLSEKLDLPKSKITIASGLSSPFKKIEIDCDEKELKKKLFSL